MNKKNFKLDQSVKLCHVGEPMDGQTGTILGKSMEHVFDFYIVLLDTPLPDAKAVVLIESCLEAV